MPDLTEAGLQEYELEQAWDLMRHHERAAAQLRAELQRTLVTRRRILPKADCFDKIKADLALMRESEITAEAFLEMVAQHIAKATRETFLVEEAQARAEKAKGTL